MTEAEMRELDEWIGVNLFNGTMTHTPNLACKVYMQTPQNEALMMSPFELPHYTTDPAAAMQVLARCLESAETLRFYQRLSDSMFTIKCQPDIPSSPEILVDADTLPLCISKFAKQLHSKD